MIHGDRVRQARELRDLTQTELGFRLGVDQSTIALIESGLRQPSAGVVAGISLQTGFPVSFFRQGPPPQFSLGSLLFRAQRSTSARQRMQALRYGEIIFESSARLAERLIATTHLRLPRLDTGETPERAAQLTRSAFGLGPDRPVPHLTNLVERSGVVVLALPTRLPKRDAFSGWTESAPVTPFVALSKGVPGDRMRYSLAHELGHLVMHSTLKGSVEAVEREANRFAAEFLMPGDGIRQEVLAPVTLTTLAELKPRWGAAMQALALRARDLGIITTGQCAYLFRQMAMRGWRTNEPVRLVPEKPRAFRKMAELLYGDPIDISRLAADARLPVPLMEEIIDAHARLDELPRRTATTEQGNLVPLRRRQAAD